MKADAWFRVYTRILDNPRLQTMDANLFRQLMNFWALAKLNNGALPAIDEIAWRLRRTPEQVTEDVAKLIDAKLLDRRGKIISPTNWVSWQTKKPVSTERVQRFRNKSRSAIETQGETLHETPSETQFETPVEHKNETQRRKEKEEYIPPTPLFGGGVLISDSCVSPSSQSLKPRRGEMSQTQQQWFESWWGQVWQKVGRGAAEKSFATHCKNQATFERIMQATKAQTPIFLEREAQYQPHPATWLNQKRWTDDIEALMRKSAFRTGRPALMQFEVPED